METGGQAPTPPQRRCSSVGAAVLVFVLVALICGFYLWIDVLSPYRQWIRISGLEDVVEQDDSFCEAPPAQENAEASPESKSESYSPRSNVTIIVTGWNKDWSESQPREQWGLLETNRECYARMHGYTLYVGDPQVTGPMPEVLHAQRLLTPESGLDWVVITQGNYLFTRFDLPIDSLAPPSNEYDVVFPVNAKNVPETFAFMIRNTPMGRRFVDIWIEEINTNTGLYTAILRAVLRFVDNIHFPGYGARCDRGSEPCCRIWPHPNAGYVQKVCYEQKATEMGITASSKPPVYFVPIHDWGLQSSDFRWNTIMDETVKSTFGIQCSTHDDILCAAYKSAFVRQSDGWCEAPLYKARPS